MITVKTEHRRYYLTHFKGEIWLDRAGHRWRLSDKDGKLRTPTMANKGCSAAILHAVLDNWLPCRDVGDERGYMETGYSPDELRHMAKVATEDLKDAIS